MFSLNLIKGRQCGECTACCSALAVRELGKPYYVRCEHVGKDGCAIHSAHPGSCKDFGCVWLEGSMTDDERPDKSGFVVSMEEDNLGVWVEFFLTRDIADIDEKRMFDLARLFLKNAKHPLKVRFIRNNDLVATSFPINAEKYPDEGEGCRDRLWSSIDGILYALETTERKRTTPLKEDHG